VNHPAPGATVPVSDIVGQVVWEGLPQEVRPAVREAVERVFDAKAGSSHELYLTRLDGTTMWFSVRYSPIEKGGEVTAALAIARDITALKKREETIENHIRDVAHEMRSPLAKAQMNLELLQEELEDGGSEGVAHLRHAPLALENIRKLGRMVDAVLDLARLQAGGLAYRQDPIHLADLIRSAVLDMEPLALTKGLALVVRLPKNLPLVIGDGEKLGRVLCNLIDNAVKFSDEGEIVVAAELAAGYVQISVSDSGCGILPENLERVFDSFFQERTQAAGAGVGLPMCRTIVAAHGGLIWAESDGRGRGATLRFTLPAGGEEVGQ
jgi:signal transduction histidine kinase